VVAALAFDDAAEDFDVDFAVPEVLPDFLVVVDFLVAVEAFFFAVVDFVDFTADFLAVFVIGDELEASMVPCSASLVGIFILSSAFSGMFSVATTTLGFPVIVSFGDLDFVEFVALFALLGVLPAGFVIFELVAFAFLAVLDFFVAVFFVVLFLFVLFVVDPVDFFVADFVLAVVAFFVLADLLLATDVVDAFTTGVVVTKYPVKIKQAKTAAKKLIFNFIDLIL